jgi:hypothetical protein
MLKGAIWYCGNSANLSIIGQEKDMATNPTKFPEYTLEKFKYIASGDNHNFAISTQGKGKN